ncbi:MAG: aldose 1-epimerase, partial [Pseudomonadota bacterium]
SADDAGRTSAIVAPGWGANILAFSYKAAGWQWPVPVLEAVDIATVALAPASYGAPLLSPTPGRVGVNQSGNFIWLGQQHTISPTRHGWLRGEAWEIEESNGERIVCTTRIFPGPEKCTLPFEFAARHEVSIGTASILSRVSLTNQSRIDLPLDVGWHPYLHRGGNCRVKIPAEQVWRLNDQPEPTPTGDLDAVNGNTDFRNGRIVEADEHWDNIFYGVTADKNGWTDSWIEEDETITLSGGGTQSLAIRRHVRINSAPSTPGVAAVRNMQLFTPPSRKAISLEPLSSVADALNLSAAGIADAAPTIVPPGETRTFEMEMAISLPTA